MKDLRGKLATLPKTLMNALRQAWIRRSAMQRATALLGAAAFGGLFLVSAAGVASPWFPRLETFSDLQGHFAAGAAALALAGLVLRSRRWVTTAVLLVVLNLGAMGGRMATVDSCPVQTAATGRHIVRVMTLNIRDTNRDYPAVERVIGERRPDIVVIEEFRQHHRAMLARLRGAYPHQLLCLGRPDCGIAIISRYPLEGKRVIGGQTLAALATRAVIGDSTLTVVGAHMSRPFSGRHQQKQFRLLTQAVDALPQNAVVVGDFNSTLWSANLARYARTSGVCASNVTHATWPQWLGPFGVPIDHVFLKRGVKLLSLHTVSKTGSDHRGIVASLSMR